MVCNIFVVTLTCIFISWMYDSNLKDSSVTGITVLSYYVYLISFCNCLFTFQEGSYQAQSNLKFLSVLKDPCHDLSEAHPKDIAPLLPKILNLIRMIWVNSEFYNTRDRLTGILRKVTMWSMVTFSLKANCLLLKMHLKSDCWNS